MISEIAGSEIACDAIRAMDVLAKIASYTTHRKRIYKSDITKGLEIVKEYIEEIERLCEVEE